MLKKAYLILLVVITVLVFSLSSFAQSANNTISASDYSEEIQIGSEIYNEKHTPLENTDEIDYSDFYKDMKKIIKEAEKESQPHIDDSGNKKAKKDEVGIKHFSLIPHSHHAYQTGSSPWLHYYWPTTVWTANSAYPDPAVWPTVAWTIGQSFIKYASWSTAVGVTDSVISAEVGFNVTASSTVTNSVTRTFYIPYQKKGRVIITSDFSKYEYDLETKYYTDLSHTLYLYSEYGSGVADGPLSDSTCDVELVDL